MTNSPPIVASVTAIPVGVPSGAPPLPPSPEAIAPSGATASGVLAAPRPATFEQLAAVPDESIDVPTGAALIARDAYGTLDVDRLLARLDDLAAPLEGRDLASLPLEEQADAVTAHVFGTLGFRGNEQDYYDPKNSLLPDVLDRKLGIPITLALVYCAVARRLGVRARGVSFPGHFLVRVDGPAATPASGMRDAL
ncbi:MAG TPA: transglutaminase-like domain-containing protein, partial [Polyangiaceae bacterium]